MAEFDREKTSVQLNGRLSDSEIYMTSSIREETPSEGKGRSRSSKTSMERTSQDEEEEG